MYIQIAPQEFLPIKTKQQPRVDNLSTLDSNPCTHCIQTACLPPHKGYSAAHTL